MSESYFFVTRCWIYGGTGRIEWDMAQTNELPNVRQFWHRAKFWEFQNFWNVENTWEGPQRCQAEGCGQYYKVFPDSMKSAELYEIFNFEKREYAFAWIECESLVEGRIFLNKVFSHVMYMCKSMCICDCEFELMLLS